ncbi:Fe-S cluster assembly ATPase SufC [Aldersonia sp. NBC_00410]|uniref:Fe-S cluster assembly ATPase SufC n=1 Tax=Aldersonia sp. NBC_00410 TaxID=2975954 RepID=UPI00224FEF97|nr:Fe-S cluster assembly ATPase SufC [Aldersonia sp. NBC_00410]MCX5045152.1 Fe-S cluster assembly ATPase SufC [Aldersonia sp. NBC_00410]
MTTLEIKDLHVEVANPDQGGEPIRILKGVDLTVRSGETHAIMGPNGSGKSTLSYAIAGHPKYTVTSGSITLDGENVLDMSVDERARAGLFLAMQYPVEVPGVSTSNFLRTAVTAVRGEAPKLRHWVKEVKTSMGELEIDPAFAERSVNEGFSGGEKKRHEILQLGLLKPKIAILDETDSGLDVDALRIVSEGVNRYKERGWADGSGEPTRGGLLLITHYTRILRYIAPDHVHVFVGGRIVESGGSELADELDANGYDRFTAGATQSREIGTAATAGA